MKVKQYIIDKEKIELHVKPANVFVRYFFLFFAILLVLLPIIGIIFNLTQGNGFHIGFLIGFGFFSLLGFYFFRLFLWNTRGKEIIKINQNAVDYYADYIYFKGNQQKLTFQKLIFNLESIGFEDEEKGVLLIFSSENEYIKCAALLPLKELEEIIKTLNKEHNTITLEEN